MNAQRYLLDSFRYAQKRYFAHNEENPDDGTDQLFAKPEPEEEMEPDTGSGPDTGTEPGTEEPESGIGAESEAEKVPDPADEAGEEAEKDQ